MDIISLNIFEKFKCIANDCKDTCCAGWRIDVDSASEEIYLKDPDLKDKIVIDNKMKKTYMKLTEDKKCSFLKDDGLCEMVIKKGPEYLCHTCKEYPRLKKLYADKIMFLLSFSCEEVTRLVFKDTDNLHFKLLEVNIPENIESNSSWIAKNGYTWETNFEIFKATLTILQLPQYKLYEKLSYLFMMFKNIDELEKSEDTEINDANVDKILIQYLENVNNEEIFNILKDVKSNEENLFDKYIFFDNIITPYYSLLSNVKTQREDLAQKRDNYKKLDEYTKDEVLEYNEKIIQYMRQNEIMLEKYLFILLSQEIFPTNFEKLEVAMKYVLHRLLLIQVTMMLYNINENTEITDEIFFETITFVTKSIENAPDRLEVIRKFVEEIDVSFKLYINSIL